MIDHVLWDTTGTPREGFRRAMWATRKLSIVVAIAALLTWVEWVEHHPPDIVVVVLLHFVFAFAAVALVVYIDKRK